MANRQSVTWFSDLMEHQLYKHDEDWPNGWEDATKAALVERFQEEVGELMKCLINHKDNQYTAEQCANTANYLMMLATKHLNGVVQK